MVNDVIKELQASLDKGIEALKKDLGKVRTGRASVSILDGIRVDYYGTPTPCIRWPRSTCPTRASSPSSPGRVSHPRNREDDSLRPAWTQSVVGR